MPRNISHTVTKEEEGRTILSLLRGVLGFSASQVRRMKENGGIFCLRFLMNKSET